MSVDLPEPEGPTTATYSLRADVEVHPAQRLHLHAARAVDLADPLHPNHRFHPHSYLSETAGLTEAARRAGK